MADKKLLEIRNLTIKSGEQILVDKLNLELKAGETLAIVGESGSGKSLSSLAVMGLLPKSLEVKGKVLFKGKNILGLEDTEMRKLRGNEIAMVFQEPMTALNPTMKCGKQVAEMLKALKSKSGKSEKDQVIALFKKVDLPRPESIYSSYPHQLSGGQKQRVIIAMAIALKPSLLIADEPTTALDASVQKGILELLSNLGSSLGMGMIFISHDLGVVNRIADHMLVMEKGICKETGPTKTLFQHPKDNYTKGLLACKPTSDTYFERLPIISDYTEGHRPKLKLIPKEHRIADAKQLMQQAPMLEVKAVNKLFKASNTLWTKTEEVHAVRDLSIQVFPGESLGLVGESGSGKTTLGRILCGLEKASSGQVKYKGKDISSAGRSEWRKLHRKIQIIFQDPYSSLNPRLRIGPAIAEAMTDTQSATQIQKIKRVEKLLERVGLQADYYERYPHEFSGGQRQRIGIARALAVKPEFIVCDESVSALDVSVQAQILNLLNDLKDEFKLTYLFISHDLAVVKYFCDRLVVLNKGMLIESGISEEVFSSPSSEYTQTLIDASHG